MLPSPLVSTDWLAAHLGEPQLRILDCSVVMRTLADGSYSFVGGRDEWQEAHIPGSVFVDVLEELAAKDTPLPMMMPSAEEFAATMAGYGVGAGTAVVLYDRSNHAWAARVWWMLRACGFDAAAVLDGGWQKWAAETRPMSEVATTYPRGNFRPRVRPELLATKQEVRESLDKPGVAIVNSLSPDEHRGTAPTRFPRAGRIAGSCNVYCQALIDPITKTYWPAPKLRELFAQTGALEADRVITYCGAGIAASSDAFALMVLGVGNVAVYDGSLAEWTADPTLPMETG
ncbi:MAG TPA: sulfurtransferase [Gammaproteobacteria bacterium]|jgi:thiosulfate/3-mercaptopyruvate sulfurtransferase